MKQSHLTLEERYLIHACFVAKFSISDTAAELGRDRSTINTERRRGCHGGQPYCPHRAQQYADLARGRSIANAPNCPPLVAFRT